MGLTRAGSNPAPGIFKKLKKEAKKAAQKSYSPYSKFEVGASVLSKNKKIYSGTNIENASYGLTICAERVAIFKGVSEGEREFITIAIYTNSSKLSYPCGACLQVMSEFMPQDAVVIIFSENEEKIKRLNELIPQPFKF